MKTILRIGRGVKVRRARVREFCNLPLETMEIDVKTELIQALIPLGLWHVKEVLEQEVRALAGERYQRGGLKGCDRWGKQWGSVYLRDQKVPIQVPRVRNQHEGKEIPLRSYERLQAPREGDEGVLRRILHGLSCRNYERCAEAIKNKAEFPREMEQIRSRRDYFRKVMEVHKSEWSEEYQYWKDRGWLS